VITENNHLLDMISDFKSQLSSFEYSSKKSQKELVESKWHFGKEFSQSLKRKINSTQIT
jgi:hypothetical protein